MSRILDGLCAPEDLSRLDDSALRALAEEMRAVILETVMRNGGHLASNLGVIELTIALHRVFSSPADKFVWDVGHQCYAHKLITGRARDFHTMRLRGGLSGFPKRSESAHDAFNTGHASTSISAALGLLIGMRARGESAARRVIAIIGDGALTGGLAYEALSHAGQLGLPLIVILNDNRMSIGPSAGSLSHYLSRLSAKKHYQFFRRAFDSAVKKIPLVGGKLFNGIVRLKRAVKAVFYTDNFFVDLGFEYVGPVAGHDISKMERVFRDVRKMEAPVVVHVVTQKGKGVKNAERDPLAFHGVEAALPHDTPGGVFSGTFTMSFSDAIVEAARKNEKIIAITAAMEKGTGLAQFRKEFPDRFFDAGIAEAHAVTFAAGLAAAGMRPVVAIYSTFLQRAADQVIHDVCLQKLPVVFAVDRAGLVAGDGDTHQGIFDIALFCSLPHINILSPAAGNEAALMLDWALAQDFPVIIRYPKSSAPTFDNPPALTSGRGVYMEESANCEICIAFTGGLFAECAGAARILKEAEISCALYSFRFIKPLDEDYLLTQMRRFRVFAVAEDGAPCICEKIEALKARHQIDAEIVSCAVRNTALPQAKREELLDDAGLSSKKIATQIMTALKK